MRSRSASKASTTSKKEDANPPSLSTDPIYEATFIIAFIFWVFQFSLKPFLSFLFFADQSVTIDFPCDFLGISMLEQPNKYYLIIRGQKIVLEADSSILLIMEKLQSYKSKVALHFEVRFVLRMPRFLFLCFCSLNLL